MNVRSACSVRADDVGGGARGVVVGTVDLWPYPVPLRDSCCVLPIVPTGMHSALECGNAPQSVRSMAVFLLLLGSLSERKSGCRLWNQIRNTWVARHTYTHTIWGQCFLFLFLSFA